MAIHVPVQCNHCKKILPHRTAGEIHQIVCRREWERQYRQACQELLKGLNQCEDLGAIINEDGTVEKYNPASEILEITRRV